jgi:hypothetical protein
MLRICRVANPKLVMVLSSKEHAPIESKNHIRALLQSRNFMEVILSGSGSLTVCFPRSPLWPDSALGASANDTIQGQNYELLRFYEGSRVF